MLIVNRNRKYQSVIGFGGAVTDSTGIKYESLSKGTRDNLIGYLIIYFFKDVYVDIS